MKIYSKRTIVSNLEDLSWTRDSQYVARFPGQRYPNWRHYFPRYFTRLLEATTESAPLNERRILSGINLGGGEGEEKSSSASEGGVYGGYTRNFGVSFDKNDEGRVDNETGRNARSGCLQ